MPWQFRKRVRLGPGVHLNVGKKSVSLSVGGDFGRTSLSTMGHTTRTFSLPGTGLYHRERVRLTVTGTTPLATAETPGESQYAAGVSAYFEGDFEAAYRAFDTATKQKVGAVSADLLAGVSLFQLGRVPDAIPHLERVVEADDEVPDAMMSRHVPPEQVRHQLEIAIVEGIYARLDVDSLAAAILLAEAYQGVGKRDKAIELMTDLLAAIPEDEAVRLSLCDLLFEAADFDGTIAVASEASPETNLGFACWIFKAQGETWKGDWNAAKDTLERALSETQADDEHALRAANENLEGTYAELGLSAKRLKAFQTTLSRRRSAAPEDEHGRRVSYENDPYDPGPDGMEPPD